MSHTPFDILQSSMSLRLNGPFAVTGDSYNGLLALCFVSQEVAAQFIADNEEAFRGRGVTAQNMLLEPITEVLEFMEEAARHGLAGIKLIGNISSGEFEFCVRIESLARDLPNALRITNGTDSLVKTQFKMLQEPLGTSFSTWDRYDILDQATALWATKSPFSDWQSGQSFFELRHRNGSCIVLVRPRCLGDWSPVGGAVPVFSSFDEIQNFLSDSESTRHFTFQKSLTSGLVKPNVINVPFALPEGLECHEIDDIRSRNNELFSPESILVTNPSGSRDNQGYLIEESLPPHSEGPVNLDSTRLLYRGASGNWLVEDFNQISRNDDVDVCKKWTGQDTFFWNGLHQFLLSPLSRSFSPEGVRHELTNMDPTDIDDFLEQFFSDGNDTADSLAFFEEFPKEELKHKYVTFLWDALTGERCEPLIHDSIFDVIKFFWQREVNEEYHHRLNGATPHGIPAFAPSSGGKEKHDGTQFRIKTALDQMMRSIINSGYRPEFADQLVALINSAFITYHCDGTGYLKDLLHRCDFDDDRNKIADRLEVPLDTIFQPSESDYDLIDTFGMHQAVSLLGEDTWPQLHRKSQYFLASALAQLDKVGVAPQFDYSLISIQIVKSLEVELTALFDEFCSSVNLSDIDNADLASIRARKDSDAEKKLLIRSERFHSESSTAGPKLMIGDFRHSLKKARQSEGPIAGAFREFLLTKPCGEWLLRNKIGKSLQKVADRYRNGGAHDSRISLDVALECRDCILGTPEKPGFLFQLHLREL
jgi:hypothetical protein